jgi:hypothetical protein
MRVILIDVYCVVSLVVFVPVPTLQLTAAESAVRMPKPRKNCT